LRTVEGTLYASLEDAYQGFASRDTSSLSGGESFLVSLALALALSDIGQGLTVDTLFIDEGFGSLSGQPLANAINTLRSLRGKNGRHVGIISHIQEVRDNIPVQIQVNKTSNNSSSTIQVVQ
jgi:exonuclease SbcC